MTRTYLRIEPSREQVVPAEIVKRLEGLREIENSLSDKYDPRKSPPTFEFLILTEGQGEEIKFYWGVDKERYLQGLKSELVSAFPDSYDIYEEAVSLRGELTPTNYPGTDETQKPLNAVESDPSGKADSENLPATLDETSIEDFEDAIPKSICWYGDEDRRGDWMTTLKEFEEQVDRENKQVRAPLASAIENLSQVPVPVVFQVLWTRRANWEKKAERRKNRIRAKMDGPVQALKTGLGDFVMSGPSREEQRERHRAGDATDIGEDATDHEKETGSSVRSRSALIDRKGPTRTFLANMRATALVPEAFPNGTETEVEKHLTALSNAFNLVDGPFYSVRGELVEDVTFSHRSNESVFEKIIEQDMSRTAGTRTRPQFILNGDELANFVTVPSLQALTHEGARGTRGQGENRTPLDLPDPDILDKYRDDGVKLTYPLDKRGNAQAEPIRIPLDALDKHFSIAAASGGGKSKLTQNILKSLVKETSGPTVVFNPKADFMLENYMRGHYKEFGDLEDVLYFDAAETLPCIPFFDIRPMLANDQAREAAIEYKIKHFDDMMVQGMGGEKYESAYVAKEILHDLIKALFDPVKGKDAYTIEELRDVLREIIQEGRIPELSSQFSHVQQNLQDTIREADDVKGSLQAIDNRLRFISKRHKLKKFFNQVPEWDDQQQEYADNGFHFQEILYSDKLILLDIGNLHREEQRVISTVILTNIWDAVRMRNQQRTAYESTPEDYCTNIIIDEAADLASSEIISDHFLPQGRGYDVGLGLIEQYPDQISEDPQRANPEKNKAYRELLNNVHTHLIGKIAITDRQAELLSFEGVDKKEIRERVSDLPLGNWLTILPTPRHFEFSAKPFYSQSPPIIPGHPDGQSPLSDYGDQQFQECLSRTIERTKLHYSLTLDQTDSNPEPEVEPTFSEPKKDVDPEGANITGLFVGEENAPDSSEDSDKDPSIPGPAESDGGSDVGTSAQAQSETQNPDTSPIPTASESGSAGVTQEPADVSSEPEADAGPQAGDGSASEGDGRELDWARDTEPDVEVLPESQNAVAAPADTSEPEDTSPPAEDEETNEAAAEMGDTFRQHFISDEDLAEAGITRTDARFLALVHDAMQDDVPGYSLLESMRELPLYDEADIDTLVDQGYLEAETLTRRRYFTVTPEGRELLGEDRKFGHGVGDLGEKSTHIVGVRLLAAFFEQSDHIDRVEIYDESAAGDTVFDVTAYTSGREAPVWVGEVETTSNNRQSVRDDYSKMADSPAVGVWLVDSQDTLKTIVTTLNQHDTGFNGDVDFMGNPTYADLREQLATIDDSGMKRVYGIRELFREVT